MPLLRHAHLLHRVASLPNSSTPARDPELVQRRSAALPLPAQRILTPAAVVGLRFDFALLQDLTGLAEDDLLARSRSSSRPSSWLKSQPIALPSGTP